MGKEISTQFFFKKMQKREDSSITFWDKKQLDFRFFQGCNKDLIKQAKNFFFFFLCVGDERRVMRSKLDFARERRRGMSLFNVTLDYYIFRSEVGRGKVGRKTQLIRHTCLAKKSYLRDSEYLSRTSKILYIIHSIQRLLWFPYHRNSDFSYKF